MSVAPARPPDIFQAKKMSCLANIRFLFCLDPYPGWQNLAEKNTLASWRIARKFAIEEVLSNRVEEYIKKFESSELALRPILSLLSAMAILISKEFDACLQGVVNNDWEKFDCLLDKKKRSFVDAEIDWEIERLSIAESICRNLREAWEDGTSLVDDPPAREITWEEKRGYLEEIGALPTTPTQTEDIYSTRRKHHRKYYSTYFRTHLSIDIFAPIENITKVVEEIISRKQAEYYEEMRKGWSNEITQGIVTEKWVEQTITNERLRHDHRRYSDKRKKSQDALETKLRSLRYYYYKKTLKWPTEKILELSNKNKWWTNTEPSSANQARAINHAERMIQTVISGKPIMDTNLADYSPINQ